MPRVCAAVKCCNSKGQREKWIIMPHVQELKLHKPKAENFLSWKRALEREDYAVSAATLVCSNHFSYPPLPCPNLVATCNNSKLLQLTLKFGKVLHGEQVPTLYMRSYPSWAKTVEELRNTIDSLDEGLVGAFTAHLIQTVPTNVIVPSTVELLNMNTIRVREIYNGFKVYFNFGKIQQASAIYKFGIELDGVKQIGLSKSNTVVSKSKTGASKSNTGATKSKPWASKSNTGASKSNTGAIALSISEIQVQCSSQSSQGTVDDLDRIDHNYSVAKVPVKKKKLKLLKLKPKTGNNTHLCKKRVCINNRNLIIKLSHKIKKSEKKVSEYEKNLRKKNEELQNCKCILASYKTQADDKVLSINKIKDHDNLVHLHTGLNNYSVFKWVFEQIEPAANSLQYWSGEDSHNLKNYQKDVGRKKSGPARALGLQDELLLTLMLLKSNFSEEYLAYLFGISQSVVSQTISTWLPFLALELKGLVYWPTPEEIVNCYPLCFQKWEGVRAILDCFEIPTERPSHVEANSQTFSAYKNRPTTKFLLACTPGGTVSFISKGAGGIMSDKEITIASGIIDKFSPGDACMVDKGFKIAGELLENGVRILIPGFVQKNKQFTEDKNKTTKDIANARIHVERVIGRVRDYKYLSGPIPIKQFDLVSSAAMVCCALTNIKGSVIKE